MRILCTGAAAFVLCTPLVVVRAQTPAIPDWALPGSATHKQGPPPADYQLPSKNFDSPIWLFDGMSDI